MFGALIKKRRAAMRMSQQQLADELDVSASLVSRWEGGVVDPPLSKATQALMFLRASPDEIVSLVAGSAAVTSSDEDPPDCATLPLARELAVVA